MYDEKELSGLMAEVEKEFKIHLNKAEESFKLAKSEDESKKDPSKEKDEAKASSESKGESDKKMESEKPADKGVSDQHQQDMSKDPSEGDKSESKEGRMEADAKENAKPMDDAHGQAEDHGYDDEDMAHMHSMYSSMSKAELKAHHDSIRKCMDGMGLAKCEDGMAKAETGDCAKDAEGYRPNGGPSDGEAAKCKTPKASDMQALEKSEKDKEIDLLKSEIQDVKKEKEAVASFLKKFLEKTAPPAGKAITSLDVIAKTEGANRENPLSKSEIHEKLLAKSKDMSLSKSDRDAINSYYFSKNVETVRHLLG
jgi:hypothetical protein